MQRIFNNIECLVGNVTLLESIDKVPALPIFSKDVMKFLEHLSKKLMTDVRAKLFPDVMAYAFWIRKGSLEAVRNSYEEKVHRIGRGVAFQIAPSNIPVQFAVSMTYSILAGNASVVRISNKHFEQTDIICNCIRELLSDGFAKIGQYICIIRYGHDDDITRVLSEKCDVRMIWGGDKTISSIRKIETPVRCIDLGFADRYSLAVFDINELMNADIEVIANDFYKDTFAVDQNACSSPRMVIWIGKNASVARRKFWKEVSNLVQSKYRMDPICSTEKLLNTAVFASTHPEAHQIKTDNLLVRMEIPEVYEDVMEYKGRCGYFFEYVTENLEDIIPLLKKECQTIVYFGSTIEHKIRKLIDIYGGRGVDRIVSVGHGTDISFVWDGIDLPLVLSRQIGNS